MEDNRKEKSIYSGDIDINTIDENKEDREKEITINDTGEEVLESDRKEQGDVFNLSNLDNAEKNEILRLINIELIYRNIFDFSTLEAAFDEAAAELSRIFELTGVRANLYKIRVENDEEVEEISLTGRAMLRVNNHMVEFDFQADEIDPEIVTSQTWFYRGKEYETPPSGLLIEAILMEVYHGSRSSQVICKMAEPSSVELFFSDGLEDKQIRDGTMESSVNISRSTRVAPELYFKSKDDK